MKKIHDMRISSKLLVTFGVVVLLYLASVGSALIGGQKVLENFDHFYSKSYQIVKEATNFRMNQYIVARGMLQVITEGDTVSAVEELQEVKSSMAAVDESMENLKVLYEDDPTLAELTALYDKLVPLRSKVVTLLEGEKYEDALKAYNKEYAPIAEEARNFLREMENLAKDNADETFVSSKTSAQNMLISVLILGAITILFVTVIWYYIARSITKPLQELKVAAEDLAAGNLQAEITYESQNELGVLADSMRNTVHSLRLYISEIEAGMKMIGSGKLNYKTKVEFKGDFISLKQSINMITSLLGESMQQISNSAEQVSGGAQQISNGAQMLSQGASEQAGSIEELAANINEISDNVRNNADDTVAASNVADAVEQEIMENSKQMDQVSEAMNLIRQTSMDITGIVKEIEDIAFQTNLLSLNAAVEAARAGDAGRGFSVVAAEIRKLANKTTDASKTTAALVQKSAKSVEEGSALIQESEQTLKHVVDGARDVASKIERISQSNIQQANFIIQIRQSIEQITDIVQGNSATSEESAAASEELAAQAQILRELVNRFEFQGKEDFI